MKYVFRSVQAHLKSEFLEQLKMIDILRVRTTDKTCVWNEMRTEIIRKKKIIIYVYLHSPAIFGKN